MAKIRLKANFIEIPWQSFKVAYLDDRWDEIGNFPGVYMIYMDREIHRIGKSDHKGILYVGKSSKLITMLNNFRNGNHPASGFFYDYFNIAQLDLGVKIESVKDIEQLIDQLTINIATPIKPDELEKAERSVLFNYLLFFGELPPLDFSIPGGRWKQSDAVELAWANDGFVCRLTG